MPEIDQQIFIDRLLETENLVDGLEDQEAEWLINWGIRHVEGLVQASENAEHAGERVNALMAVMRKVNQIVADRAYKSQAELAADLKDLARKHELAFGHARAITDDNINSAAEQLVEMEPGEAVRFAIDLVSAPDHP